MLAAIDPDPSVTQGGPAKDKEYVNRVQCSKPRTFTSSSISCTDIMRMRETGCSYACAKIMDEDDPFESLLFIEDRLQEQGYGEGRGHGVAEGLKEAAEAGKANGVDVGWEVGYYLGFAETWLRLLKTKPLEHEEKKIRVLSTLVEMLRSFRILDVESTEFRRELSQLQAKYKQTLALLKVPLAAVKAKADLSF